MSVAGRKSKKAVKAKLDKAAKRREEKAKERDAINQAKLGNNASHKGHRR